MNVREYRALLLPNHRAQGGEFPIVIVFLHDLHAPLLQRTLLYTAITRAKQRCLIVGTKTALTQAVRNQRSLQRYTGLAAALQRACPVSTLRSVNPFPCLTPTGL